MLTRTTIESSWKNYQNRREGKYKEFRLFFIYDGPIIVVLFNCYTKKSRKAPNKEIDKALRLKEEYRYEKENASL